MEALSWLILFVVLLVIEIMTLGLATIWFAGGALVAFVASLTGVALEIQIILFLVVSLLLLFSTRPIAVKYLNNSRIKTNVDSLSGQNALVLEQIENKKSKGRVVVNGQEWTARTMDEDTIIEKDKIVTILHVSGVKLIVEEKKEDMN